VEGVKFDFSSEITTNESGDPNNCFMQLIFDSKFNPQEISISTDGSWMGSKDGSHEVGCALVIPCLDKDYKYKLNILSSSYTTEIIAMNNALEIAMSEKWVSINICSDSLSTLTKLKFVLSSVFPIVCSDLSPSLMEFSLKITRLSANGINVRFTWSLHIGIKGNELADICAKSATQIGTHVNNLISYKEIISFLIKEYKTIDFSFR